MKNKLFFGFTLIELLITTSIMALLVAVAVPSFQTFTRNQALRRGVEQVKTDLRTVQNRAVSGIDRKKPGGDEYYYWWGIDFKYNDDPQKYAFVQSDNKEDHPGEAIEEEKRVKKLPGDLTFGSNGSNGSNVTIWFKMITGSVCTDSVCPLPVDPLVDASVEVKVCLGGSGGSCQGVTVSRGGEIK